MTAALGCAAPAAAVAAPAFGPPVSVSPAGERSAQAPAAAYDASATLEIGWATSRPDESSALAAARRPLGQAFSAAPDLATSERELEGPVLATTPAGTVVAAWTVTSASGTNRIFAGQLDSSGNPGLVVAVSDADDDASEPAIAVGADGRLAIAWIVTEDESGDSEAQAVHGMLGLPLVIRRVSGATPGAAQPQIAFDQAGTLHVAFTRFLDEGAAVQVAAETAGGTFAAARTVSGSAADAEEPAIAPAPTGGLALAWTVYEGEDDSHVVVGIEPTPGATVVAAGVPGGGQTYGAQLEVDPATATLTVAWIRSLAGQASALVTSRAAGGELAPPTVVSGADDVAVLDLAFSAAGDAVLAWQRSLDEEEGDIRAALFDAPRIAPPPPPPPPPPQPPVLPPVAPPVPALLLTSFAVDPQCIRYGAPFSGVRRRLSFSFVLSDAATVRLSIQRRLNSRAQRVCPPVRAKGAAGQLGPPTFVDVPSGLGPGSATIGEEGEAVAGAAALQRPGVTLTRRLRAGRQRLVLRQAPTTFAPGTYVVTAAATAPDGRRSASSKVKSWILLGARTR